MGNHQLKRLVLELARLEADEHYPSLRARIDHLIRD